MGGGTEQKESFFASGSDCCFIFLWFILVVCVCTVGPQVLEKAKTE